jgi:hypothetical protein
MTVGGEVERRKEEGGRRKEEGGRRKKEGGSMKLGRGRWRNLTPGCDQNRIFVLNQDY